MSAFIQSKAHIDALVTLALVGPKGRPFPRHSSDYFYHDGRAEYVTTATANATAARPPAMAKPRMNPDMSASPIALVGAAARAASVSEAARAVAEGSCCCSSSAGGIFWPHMEGHHSPGRCEEHPITQVIAAVSYSSPEYY